MADIDLLIEQPTTGETASVQVKLGLFDRLMDQVG